MNTLREIRVAREMAGVVEWRCIASTPVTVTEARVDEQRTMTVPLPVRRCKSSFSGSRLSFDLNKTSHG